MRRQQPWREVMFKGLPTELERKVTGILDDILARRIGELEPLPNRDSMTPEQYRAWFKSFQPEIDKFLEVSSAPAMHGTCLFSWKRIPLAKIQRFRDDRVIVSELGGG